MPSIKTLILMRKARFFILVLALLATCGMLRAQDSFERAVYVSPTGDSLLYRYLRPENEQADKKYPLVLFLHGAGECGTDNEKQLDHGGQMWLNPVNREKYPAFVLAPQCTGKNYWGYVSRPSFVPEEMPAETADTPEIRLVKELLDQYLALPQVDKSRVYVMGLSMGGMATFDVAIRYPDIFAAAIPICGSVNPKRITPALRPVKFRLFHGDADNVVPVEGSRHAYRALKAAGVTVDYVEFPGCNHGSWNPAFGYPDFMEWLFNCKKK